MLDIQLTQQAEADLASIANYTLNQFGLQQAQYYYSGLTNAFTTLAQHPDLGIGFQHIKPGLHRFIYQHHTIYYQTTDTSLLIYRVLNQKQDPIKQL